MITYKTLDTLKGPLVFIHKTKNIGYQEIVSITDTNGKHSYGQVIALDQDTAVVQLFENPAGFKVEGSKAVFSGETKKISLSPAILGRVFDGYGRPIDGKGGVEGESFDINQPFTKVEGFTNPLAVEYRDINGGAINPASRAEPNDFIQTGISGIDLVNTVVKGQKIPIFSGNGLPDLELLATIAANAKTKKADDNFVVVVAGMGITNDQYAYLKEELAKTGALDKAVMFINLASDAVVERILTPRLALTTAEYLAYTQGFSVLVLMFDMTNYANALREISSAKNEIPGRAGYPGYLYTDLATLYERAGIVEGSKGSITQIPILTMPNDDKTHPIPDLTGYITEGQITLDRSLHKKGIFPPIDIHKSLSRLKDKGQGEGKTREDHGQLSDQIFASLAEGLKQEELALVLGRESLTETGRKYLDFNKAYYETFLHQGDKAREIEETLEKAWDVLSILPRVELKKIKDATIEKYGKGRIR